MDRCFEYHRGTTSWEKAEHDCFRKGMHLASIHTAEEGGAMALAWLERVNSHTEL